ncbi:serine/threonine-protein kinase 54-like isoform X2 [Euphorbia lathyris]|uniref:serine/threonine-protein kinase 54-like isoform X2 n=1 Tax=Euphorbia lathyris TaxID=212925 RepID=UPI0033138F4E
MIDSNSLESWDGYLDRLWITRKKKAYETSNAKGNVKEEWELDPHKLTIKQFFGRRIHGFVYKGVYDDQDVTVKFLEWGDEDNMTKAEIVLLRKAFKQEVSVWKNLTHPNVCKFIGGIAGTLDGSEADMCCIVSEYESGGTLKSYLINNHKRKLNFKTVMQLALDLARGLSYLHSKNIVHRSVKTESMLLDENLTIKISDFGVARFQALIPNEMTGCTGSYGYMAPEVFFNEPYNRKCDVYSFGICLWEIYCCEMPYPNHNFSQATSAVVYGDLRPEVPKCCPKSVAKVMKSCWDKDPNKRPEMEEVVSMLEGIDVSTGLVSTIEG